MNFLGLKNTLDGLTRASGVRWHGHFLRRTLDFKVAGRRERGRPNITWKRQVDEHIDQILKKEASMDKTKWHDGINKLSRNMR